MKAAVVCANEDVQYLDYEEPIPGPGEVRLRFGHPESAVRIFRECFTMEYTFIRSYLDMNSPEMLWRSEKVVTKVKSETEYPVHR